MPPIPSEMPVICVSRFWLAIRAITALTVSRGTENPSPCAIGIIAVVIPTTRPALSTSGPPELPGLIGVSVWMRCVILCTPGASSVRSSALTTPAVTVQFRPYGLPTAITSCPTRSGVRPSSATGRWSAPMRNTATSTLESLPTSPASNLRPSASVT